MPASPLARYDLGDIFHWSTLSIPSIAYARILHAFLMHEHPLVAFYRGTGADSRGRYIHQILSFTLDELEFTHDYIQWLFPLYERSGVTPDAPVLDTDTVVNFRRDRDVRKRLRASVETMLSFYGLQLGQSAGSLTISRTSAFAERAEVWLTPRNHNFLRLTRILKCLAIVDAAPLARAILASLEQIVVERPGIVNERSLEFWRNAIPPR